MKHFCTLLLAASCLTARGQCDAPDIQSELIVLGCCTEVLIPLPEGYEYQINGSSVTQVVANGNSTIQLEWSIDVPFEVEGMSLVYMSDSTIFAQSQDILTWEESRQDCLSKGGHLATFSSQLENEAVFDALPFQKGFIGLVQNTGSSSFLEPSGGWEWITGEPLMYSFWRSGEPNNQVNSSQQTGGEDFGEMQGNQGGRWNDIPSYGSDYYVCEFSPNTSSCSGVVEVVVTCLEGSPDGFCGSGTQWDAISQTCIVTNPSDTDFDGCVSMTDLLDLLTVFGTCNEVPWSCGDPLEYQGYDYETVQIGEQCWFAENLRATSYRNGEGLLSGLGQEEWLNTSEGALASMGEAGSSCQHYHPDFDACDQSISLFEFGLLYNGYAVGDERGLCPSGWKIPSDEDFMVLESHLGMAESELNDFDWRGTDEGVQMKSMDGWSAGGAGVNSSGFNGKSAGYRRADSGAFNGAGYFGHFWTSTSELEGRFNRKLDYAYDGVKRNVVSNVAGYSIRCIQDSE